MKSPAILTFLVFALAVHLGAQSPVPPKPVVAPATGGGKSVAPQKDNCGLLYGENHSLTFCGADGWVLDNTIGNQDGIYAAFYPVGSTWDAARASGTVMYINAVAKDPDSTLASMMEGDAKEAKEHEKSTVVKKGDAIKAGDDIAPVQLFAPGAFLRFEAVAYFDTPKVLVMFIATSKNEDAFKRDYKAFVQLVQSYKFLSSNVKIEKK